MTEIVPSQRMPQGQGRMSRWQLAVVGAVVALAAGIGLVLGFTLVGQRASGALGAAASYLPADTVMYGETRLDLSPTQAGSLRAILHRFPAADEDVVLLDAIGDALDQGFSAAGTSLTYDKDVASWFDGRVAFAALDYPVAANTDVANAKLPRAVALLGVRDAGAATTFGDALRDLAGSSGVTLTSSQHAGVTIWSSTDSETNSSFAYAVTPDELLIANGRASVETLLDVHVGSQSLGARQDLQALIGQLPTDRVGFFAVDMKQMVHELRTELQAKDPAVGALLDPYINQVPALAVAALSLEDDAFVLTGASSMPGGDLAPANSRRDLAARVPGDALLFADGSDVGKRLAQVTTAMKAALAAQPSGSEMTKQLDQVESALGAKLEDFVSWIGDGALAVGATNGTPYGGLVLEANDVQAATARLRQLRSLAELGVGQAGAQIKVSTATVAGVEVTTISATAPGDMSLAPGVSRQVVVQYAIKDDTVLIGFGDHFVGRSLGLAPGDSLAASSRFQQAVGRFGGDDNAGVTFLDLAGVRQAVELTMAPMLPDDYATQVKPNTEPFDYLANVQRVEGGVVVSRGGVVLR
ncbi:MAG TPA: DUF3352 domain-containing protein [Candidatus Limnocylindria bacterium]